MGQQVPDLVGLLMDKLEGGGMAPSSSPRGQGTATPVTVLKKSGSVKVGD